MLFYPLAWRGVPAPARLARLAPRAFGRVAAADGSLPPFGPLLGWQGVVPAKAPRMARDLVAVVAGDGGLASVRAALDVHVRVVERIARDSLAVLRECDESDRFVQT